MRCKICGQTMEDDKGVLVRHLFFRHRQEHDLFIKGIFDDVITPAPIRGGVRPVHDMPGVYEPDDEQMRSFKETSDAGLAEVAHRIRRYYEEEKSG